MSNTLTPTAITGTPAVAPTSSTTDAAKTQTSVKRPNPARQALKTIASLRLTVVLFALAMLLVFFGTLAQKDTGIWNVVGKYFRWWWVWVPFQIFFPSSLKVQGGFPFIGGWSLGVLLLVNVVSAHIIRFRYTWKRLGIVLTHAGIITLLLGELITGLYAVEANLTVHENESINFVEERDKAELAFVFPATKDDAERHIVFPENVLKKGGRLTHPELPFDVEVVKYMTNSDLVRDDGKTTNIATTGEGKEWVAVEKKEAAGADSSAGRDIAATYVRLYKKGTDQALDTYLLSVLYALLPNQPDEKVQVAGDDRTFRMSLRFKRVYKPYTVFLQKFNSDYYPGTSIPKNYSSEILFSDSSHGVKNMPVTIRMNSPLRYQGETFFQADWTRDGRKGTVLQVVRNPGWLLPYVSCALVAVGLLLHFGMYLVTFIQQQSAETKRLEGRTTT
jgi:hypothetical protein